MDEKIKEESDEESEGELEESDEESEGELE
jgi:hypothetical protein